MIMELASSPRIAQQLAAEQESLMQKHGQELSGEVHISSVGLRSTVSIGTLDFAGHLPSSASCPYEPYRRSKERACNMHNKLPWVYGAPPASTPKPHGVQGPWLSSATTVCFDSHGAPIDQSLVSGVLC